MDLSMLNPPQREAVLATEGPLLVLAGAGSGKTRVLTHRIAYLLENGVPAWSILAITFTNKAAREMKDRVEALAGEGADGAWISTFHSACARILRRDIEKLGYERSFTIYDTDDQMALMRTILKEMDLNDKLYAPRDMLSTISDAKNRLRSPSEWLKEQGSNYRNDKIADIYRKYDIALKKNNSLDFDDLLIKTLELLVQHPPVLEAYQTKFRYILVDEYQDTNGAQYQLVKLLSARSRNLCVVGDDDQSIYGWRGADIRNILDFEKDFPDTKVIKLEQNYRSVSNILDAANQVIAHNQGRKEKALWTDKGEGEKLHIYSAQDERDEAVWVQSKIKLLLKLGDRESDMAILYRVNALSRVLEETLVRAGIRYRVYGGMKFYERKEVKDLVCYLRAIANPMDDGAIRRIINEPKRAIGDATVDKLAEYAARNDDTLMGAVLDSESAGLSARAQKSVESFAELMTELAALKATLPLADFVEKIVEKTGYAEQYKKVESDENTSRLQNIAEFIGGVKEYLVQTENPSLEDYLENVALITDMDRDDGEASAVTLMTMHSAKGLEFKNVFIVGAEDTIFPTMRSQDNPEKLEEERRLCYVAITRAKQRLFISWARMRMLFGRTNMQMESRFLAELPTRLCEDENLALRSPTKLSRPTPAQTRAAGPMQQQRPASGTPAWQSNRAGASSQWQNSSAASTPPWKTAQAGKSTQSGRPQITSPDQIPGVTRGMPNFVGSQARTIEPQVTLFNIGDRVQHRKFGPGLVVATSGTGSDARVTIEFPDEGEKVFKIATAPIIKLGV